MRVIIDTHLLLWALFSAGKLSDRAGRLLSDPAVELWVSAASIWEIGIKHRRFGGDPHRIPLSAAEALQACLVAGYGLLPIRPDHVVASAELPALHGDPFDRIMIAQAKVDAMMFATADHALPAYGPPVVAV